MTAIERIIKAAREQQAGLAGALCTSPYCSGTCHVCAARRRGMQIEMDGLEAAHRIEQLTRALQAVARHAACGGHQSPNDCLSQCISDAERVLDMPNAAGQTPAAYKETV